jgi:hypothetical protein
MFEDALQIAEISESIQTICENTPMDNVTLKRIFNGNHQDI